jgi:putative ABC transport system permease protein
MGVQDRLFRVLLRVLPAEFRGDYERELAATFRAERRATESSAGLTRVWAATIADVCRTAPGEHFDILKRDLAYAFRMLGRRPTLTATAVLTLALGIGANTAIFSVVNGVLFAPLPYPDADRLVLIEEARADGEPGTTGYLSFDDMRRQNESLDSVAALAGWSAILAGDGRDAERVVGARVTWNYLQTIGLRPALGRDFAAAEDHPDRRRVAIISDALWKRRYGADPNIIGRPFTVNQLTYTLAGVMPPGVDDLVVTRKFAGAEVYTLLGYNAEQVSACRTCRHIHVVGRLKAGVDISEAQADLTRIYQSLSERYPKEYDRPRVAVTPVRDYFLGVVKTPLYLLWGAVGLLLLMACANIANLLLIRASEREEEIAIRRALGVSPARMLRQLLTEAVVLALLGGAIGGALAWWGTGMLTINGPTAIPRLQDVRIDGSVLGYALLISLVTGVIFGMAPARSLLVRQDVVSVHSWRTTAGPGAWRYRAALIALNVAMSAVLLIGSGLLVRSFTRLMTVDAGFDPGNSLTLQLTLTGEAYDTNAAINRFYDEVSSRIRALPSVIAVSGATQLPLTGSIDRAGITIANRPEANPAAASNADRYAVRPEYFAAMRIPLITGRLFSEADATGAPPVAIIGRTMAAQLWPGESPIGQQVRVAGGDDNPFRTIVGVVGDVRHYGLHLPETLQVYIPHAQTHYPQPFLTMLVRTSGDRDPLALVPSIREFVRAVDAAQPVTAVETYEAVIAKSMATRRFTLTLLALFAGTALLLAIVGLYGALSYVVSQRQREMGVRVALGAGTSDIVRLVIRQGMTPAVVGLASGLVLGLAGGRIVASMLFEVSPADALTFTAVASLLVMAALAACVVPARNAAKVQPSLTLKAP